MNKKQHRFKTQFFTIDGHYNIPGFVICAEFGYEFQTFCCSGCGEVYVLNTEGVRNNTFALSVVAGDRKCPTCNVLLRTSLVNYPENIFYKGRLLKNLEAIDRAYFEDTFIKEVYSLN